MAWFGKVQKDTLKILFGMQSEMQHGALLIRFVFSLWGKVRNPVIWLHATIVLCFLKPVVSVVTGYWTVAQLLAPWMINLSDFLQKFWSDEVEVCLLSCHKK